MTTVFCWRQKKKNVVDECTLAEYSTSHIDVKATAPVASKTSEFGTMTAINHGGCSKRGRDFYEFRCKLLSLDRYNLVHLKKLAHSTLSLDITEENWRYLWELPEFIAFINKCAVHTTTEVLVESLLKNNETARKAAPEDFLAKFGIMPDNSSSVEEIPRPDNSSSVEEIPRLVNNLTEVKELMRRNISCDHLRQVLKDSVNGNPQLKRTMIAANALIHWSDERGDFEEPWCSDTVTQALANIDQYEQRRPIPQSRVPREGNDLGRESGNVPAAATPNGRHESASDQIRPTPSSRTVRSVHKSQMEYYRIAEILSKPEVKETELCEFKGKTLPYILQRVKMRGSHVLHPSALTTLVCRQPIPASTTAQNEPFGNIAAERAATTQFAFPVSRLDCFNSLLDTVDNIVARDLLHVMSQFPMALPLVRRNVSDARKYTLMTTLLRGAAIKWETETFVEHSLFNDPFKLLVAVRLGNNDTGKSAILNQILARDSIFSTRGEPGSDYGKPATVNGSVEFIWLTEETCKSPLWETVVHQYKRGDTTINLLANLHGDATENPDIITLLNHCFQCGYLAFIMPDCNETQWQNFKAMIPPQEHIPFIRVDPADYKVANHRDILSSRITEDQTLRKVRNCLGEALEICSVVKCVNSYTNCPLVSLAAGIETELSQKVVDYVASNTCKATKDQLQLQKCFDRGSKIHLTTTTHSVVTDFIKILQSPLHKAQRSVIHLENDISRLCNAETQTVRVEFSNVRADLINAMMNPQSDPKDIEGIRKNVSFTLSRINEMNLGVEHFLREVGYLYQLHLTCNTKSEVLRLPKKVAELFLNGHPLELLDGDSGHIQMPWLNAIFNSVVEKHPKLRVYVVSIIGLQSSGKSTLLNSLFACRFAVSMGRCSRGLFMRLLFLDEKLAKAWKVDAILLIDTEGLGSPEKMGDDDAQKKDRLLATFVMGISNLTIINVLGEYMNELTEIMQIAVVTMTRLEHANIAPDILMVQHHLTTSNVSKLYSSEQQFCEAINSAINLAEQKGVQVGVRSAKCLTLLFDRIQKGTMLTHFHPYKDGATANAAASEAYHNDVVAFYEKILGCCKSSTSVIELTKWKTLLESYWDSVTQEDFALRFKNIKEIRDFIDRGQRISLVKQAIDAVFNVHIREEKRRIIAHIREIDDKSSHKDHDDFLADINRRTNLLPHGCMATSNEMKCKCKEACEREKSLYKYVQGQPYEIETQSTIKEFIDIVRTSTTHKLSQIFDACAVQQGFCAEFDDIITAHIKRHLQACVPGSFTHENRKQITEEILEKLSEAARDKDDKKTVREKIVVAILNEYQQSPDIEHRFNSEISRFEDVLQSQRRHGIPRVVEDVMEFFMGRHNAHEFEHLKSMTDSIPREMTRRRQADCYEDGMVSELNQEVTRLVDEFSTRLTPEQKLNIHVWTLQQFCKRMEYVQAAWDKKNKPSSILKQNTDRYVQIINTRLKYGFSCIAEAGIIGQHFLSGAQQKAILAENNEKIRAVESLVWTTNSEKVRLKYFKHLAEQVRDGKQDAALAHFDDPTKHIETWYKETVDQHRSESFRETFSKTFTQEFESVRQEVKNAKDIDCVVSLAKKYNAFLELQSYQPSPAFKADMTCIEDLKTMKAEIVNTMEANKDKFCVVDDSVFSRPSADKGVMARLGCTARCFWCGALCWGQRGHEGDRGETKKHHSSHQPGGLAGISYRVSTCLIAQPCHEYKDGSKVHFGKYYEHGILWKDAKEKHFSDWKFDRHCIAKFDDLMRWFFQELHNSIAKKKTDRKAATRDDLEKYNCKNLSYYDIMCRIVLEIA